MLFRNILSLIAVLTAAGVPAGCSTTARLTRRQATAHLAQLSRTERQSKVRDDRPQVVRVERDSSDYYLVPVERDGQGEALGTVPIEEVVVVARVRSIPERRGRVTLDFNVELPKELLGRSRSVVITPFLHRQDEQIPLDDIIIRGALFDRVQQRDYWQYTTYLGRFRPDSVRAERAFQRFVKYPYAQDARLDSLIENRTSISYYYSQEVPTEETSRKMLITLRGRVEGLDDSAYTLPPSDTLTYTVSSLLSFLDTLPRYRIRVIDKYVTVNDRYSLSFLTGDARLVDTLGNNARELARIAALMERIVTQREFHVDSIVLTASASPEGRRGLNERLSQARAEALRSYLAGCFGRRADRLLTIRSAGELWPELTARIARDDRLAHRDEILGIIRRIGDPDRREEEIRRRYPAEYACIRAEHYPALRAVKLRCHLRRVGTVKDTIHTTEPDTAYLRGRQLLEKRKYTQALYVLHDYRDRNTAIALLSLGQDREALRILEALPATAISEYLRAIACSRLGRKAEGRRHFLEACRRDERMEYRAALDPEIDELLKD